MLSTSVIEGESTAGKAILSAKLEHSSDNVYKF